VWYHSTITYDGNSTTKFYSDGVLQDVQNDVSDIENRANSTSIGGEPVGKELIDTAYIDDVTLYERELTKQEVGELYDAT
jgi:hypothetical protein